MKTFADWVRFKLHNGYYCLNHSVRVSELLHQETESHKSFAKVTLFAKPAARFQYVSKVKWDHEIGSWGDIHILNGILDEMFTSNMIPTLGARVVLEECEYDEADPALSAMYLAARKATKTILNSGSSIINTDFRRKNKHRAWNVSFGRKRAKK